MFYQKRHNIFSCVYIDLKTLFLFCKSFFPMEFLMLRIEQKNGHLKQ